MTELFYNLAVGTESTYLGFRYVKVPYSVNGGKRFNAVGIEHEAIKFIWNQRVTIKD